MAGGPQPAAVFGVVVEQKKFAPDRLQFEVGKQIGQSDDVLDVEFDLLRRLRAAWVEQPWHGALEVVDPDACLDID